MTRTALFILLALTGIAPVETAHALTPRAQSGVAYLTTTQNGDGSWGGTPTSLASKLHTTAEAVDALRAVGQSGLPAFGQAQTFLGAQTPSLTELIARKVIARAGLADVSADTTTLLARQNADGGWGAGAGFASNVLDTALALRGLHAVGVPRGVIVRGATVTPGAPHLLAIDVPPGSTQLRIVVTALSGTVDVRIRSGTPPSLGDPFFRLTAAPVQIILTPTSFPALIAGTNFVHIDAAAAATYSLEMSVTAPGGNGATSLAGARYLVNARNADGGWGLFSLDGDSRVYFTAEAALGLLGVTPLGATISFLTGRHRADGGFGDLAASTAFETALALRVLLPLGVDPATLTPSPVAHLASTQLGNGSWVDDPYSTALAVRAIEEAAGAVCGDGMAGPGEDCDGADFGGASCATLGFGGGTLACSGTCTYDTSGCSGATTTTTTTIVTTTTSTTAITTTTTTTTSTTASTTAPTTTTTSTTSTTLPAFALDHFLLYKAKTSAGTPKFVPFAPVTLTDQFGSARYVIDKPRHLGVPADKNGEGITDAVTHLHEYQVKPVKGSPAFVTRRNVQITNQCNTLRLEVSKPDGLLVPTRKSLVAPPPEPALADHQVDHYLCYKVKVQTKLADGTPLPKFPKGLQVVVADQFQSRRYDLKKITRLCNPVDKSGAPVVVSGTNAGQPFPITPAPIRHPAGHLVCYQAVVAKKLIPQTGCGPTTPGDPGITIDPAQPKHAARNPIFVNNQFGPAVLASIKEAELCIPSTKALLAQ